MLAPPRLRCLDRPVAVSLEQLVPADHFYRHLDATLDLSVVRVWVADRYASSGRPSIDPVIFFKLQLIMFFEGIRSERQLVKTASLNLVHCWYLGYHLDEPLPDHSSLTRIRQRLGLAVFRRFFEYVVDCCDAAGLIGGQEVLADATKVPGNADLDSLVPRLKEVVDEHLVELIGKQDEPAEAGRWDVLEHCKLPPDRPPSPGYERLSHRKISLTNPDATPMSLSDCHKVLGYQAHYLVDGGKARIILHCLVTPGDVMENQPFLDQFRRTCFRRKLRPKRVIADTAYGTVANRQAIEGAGIRMYTPLPDWEPSSPISGAPSSPTTRSTMSITVRTARSSPFATLTLGTSGSCIVPVPRSARRACSGRRARRTGRAGLSIAPSMPICSSTSGATKVLRRSPRPCASARSGSRPYLPRRSSGTA